MSQDAMDPKDSRAGDPGDVWARGLQGWAIPPEILAAAPVSPWTLPVELFRVDGPVPDSPSHRLARESMPPDGSVLDLGQGGGRASFALVPPAAMVIGVDERPEMIAAAAHEAERLGVGHLEILGRWPDVADQAPSADVVVAHHVAFNVPDLAAFALAAHAHARHRVVFELPQRHPLSWMSPLWEHFWGITRPAGPTAQDAIAVLQAAGLNPKLEVWDGDRPASTAMTSEERVAFIRRRLCLDSSRDDEVAAQLQQLPPRQARTATLWWDVDRADGVRAAP